MSKYINDLIEGGWSLIVGLGVTIRACFKPTVTLQYPHESLTMTPRYRGHIELVRDPETETHRCISCGMCQKNCPSECITMKSEKREGIKGKVLTQYVLDFTTCSLCGQCVENCKSNALQFSKEYNLASRRKEDFIFDLLKRLHPEGVPEPVPAEPKPRGEGKKEKSVREDKS